MKPLNDCVLVKVLQDEEYVKYKGYNHIVLPEKYAYGPQDRPPHGKVVAFGPKCQKIVKQGDTVMWGKWAGVKFEYECVKYATVKEHDLLTVLGC